MNRCAESKHLAIIICCVIHWMFDKVEREATTSLCNIPVFLCAVRLRASISGRQRLGVAGQMHHASPTADLILLSYILVQNKLLLPIIVFALLCRNLPRLFLPVQLHININVTFPSTVSCTQVIIGTRGLGIVYFKLTGAPRFQPSQDRSKLSQTRNAVGEKKQGK